MKDSPSNHAITSLYLKERVSPIKICPYSKVFSHCWQINPEAVKDIKMYIKDHNQPFWDSFFLEKYMNLNLFGRGKKEKTDKPIYNVALGAS